MLVKVSLVLVKHALDNWFWVGTTNFFGLASCEPLISTTAVSTLLLPSYFAWV